MKGIDWFGTNWKWGFLRKERKKQVEKRGMDMKEKC